MVRNCPGGRYPVGNCPGGRYPVGNCPVDVCPDTVPMIIAVVLT